MYPKSLCSVNRSIPVGQRRAVITRKDGKMYASTAIMPGDFLLADGSFSASTVFRQERGIFIGKDDKYIELFPLSDKAVTREEAFQYCLENRVSLPSLEEMGSDLHKDESLFYFLLPSRRHVQEAQTL